MSVNKQWDYRSQLKSELERRKLTNSRYSLRSFAKSVDLSPAFLSKVLKGQKNISVDRAFDLAEKLGYTDSETEEFIRMVQLANSGSARLKNILEKSFQEPEQDDFLPLDLATFQIISDWYHYTILEYSCCAGADMRAGAVAKKIGITEAQAQAAIERLVSARLLVRKKGLLTKSEKYIATPSGIPSKAIQNFHSQMIHKAGVALQNQSPEVRDISGITMAISKNKLELAKKEIQTFRRRLTKLLDAGKPDSVFQLNIQFFSLFDLETEK